MSDPGQLAACVRRLRISSSTAASTRCRVRRKLGSPTIERGPSTASRARRRGMFMCSVSSRNSPRRRSSEPVRSGPKTTRIIASRVISCIRGHSSNGRPRGHVATASRVTSEIISPYPSIADRPWNGGSISLRRVMCSGSSSSITERGPSTGPSSVLASPTPSLLGSAVNTRLMSSGSHTSTHVPPWRTRKVKVSP